MSQLTGSGNGRPGLVSDAAYLTSVVRSALWRSRRQTQPSNWSRPEWDQEAEAEGVLCALRALPEFDPGRGVGLEQYLRSKIIIGVFNYYRREIGWARRGRRLESAERAGACEVHDVGETGSETD